MINNRQARKVLTEAAGERGKYSDAAWVKGEYHIHSPSTGSKFHVVGDDADSLHLIHVDKGGKPSIVASEHSNGGETPDDVLDWSESRIRSWALKHARAHG